MVLFRAVGILEHMETRWRLWDMVAGTTKSKNVSEQPECPSPCLRRDQQAFDGCAELMNEVMKD